MEIIHHVEALQEADATPCEQPLIQKHEVWFARAKEFQGRHPIRSEDDTAGCLLCKRLTKVESSGKVIFYEKERL